ncbi:hypothetical protein ACFRFU_34830 [Streptomyces sp. NPDC056704]|uniref:hypothetical protein n=1 Tax=Streptomyces sp. NPDC056704 TaxID=3345917 RepID=UPI0036A16110
MIDVVLSHEREFGGISFPILGGELQGWIRLGIKSGKVRPSSAGEWMFNFAEPQFVQCGLVCRVDGYFGVSWSDEFLPWHADVRHLIETSAIWADLAGWRKSALCDGNPSDVLDALKGLSREDCASSRETSWWLGDAVAVYIEPHFTYLPDGSFRIHLMTSDSESDRRVKRTLEEVRQSGVDLLVRSQNDLVVRPEECPFG